MSLNQQLSARALVSMPSRAILLMAVAAIVLLAAGCQTAEPVRESRPAAAPAPADNSRDPANDMTATEAAVAAMNDAPAAESSAPTSQLLRPDAPVNYTVKRGDTLWDISAVFLKDPWFWPEIWQINPQVENPHLIYPGDVLSLAVGAGGDARVFISQYSGARLQPRLRSDPLQGPIDTIPFAAVAAFLSKPTVLSKEEAIAAPHILGFRDEHMIAGTGHEIYVKDLNGQLNQRYAVMHIGDPIHDIGSREILGYQAYYVATAVVNNPGEVSKAVLTEGAREALEGDRLIFQEGEVPLTFTPHAPTNAIDGQIIAVADNVEQIGQYQVVVLNRGGNEGLTPGAVLAVDQLGAVVRDKYGGYPWKKKAFAKEVRLPSERAGTLIVFKVFDRISYGLVIGASGPMRVADRVYNP
jgi:hypothetical protein